MKPVEGSVSVPMSAGALWDRFVEVEAWPSWNRSIAHARVACGVLHEGATLVWSFRAIRRWLPYRMPARARIVELVPGRRLTWEVTVLPGFFARHSYAIEAQPDGSCRFGSHEEASGPVYRALRRFWDAHFRFVLDESLAGARRLADGHNRTPVDR